MDTDSAKIIRAVEAHEQKIKTLFRNSETTFKRLDEQMEFGRSITALQITLERINGTLDRINETTTRIQSEFKEHKQGIGADIRELERRIDELENKPGKRWETFINAGVAAVGGAIAGAIVSTLL